jgi:nucleotide-binding universal stress UspA family protein
MTAPLTPDTRAASLTPAPTDGTLAPIARLLVGTDGSDAAVGALRIAEALHTRDHCDVTVLSVVEPTMSTVPGTDLGVIVPPIPIPDPAYLAARERAIRAQMIAAGASSAETIRVDIGAPATLLVSEAARVRADVAVMGLGRHGPVDRLFGSETAVRCAKSNVVPVLAVPTLQVGIPRHAVVGMDFSQCAIQAARLAARIVGPTGRLTLVHVEPVPDAGAALLTEWHQVYAEGITASYARVVKELHLPASFTIETATLTGHSANELLEVATRAHATLVAVGRHSYGAFERFILGSVATRVLRSATCAVLVAPEPHAGVETD